MEFFAAFDDGGIIDDEDQIGIFEFPLQNGIEGIHERDVAGLFCFRIAAGCSVRLRDKSQSRRTYYLIRLVFISRRISFSSSFPGELQRLVESSRRASNFVSSNPSVDQIALSMFTKSTCCICATSSRTLAMFLGSHNVSSS